MRLAGNEQLLPQRLQSQMVPNGGDLVFATGAGQSQGRRQMGAVRGAGDAAFGCDLDGPWFNPLRSLPRECMRNAPGFGRGHSLR
jgi:hypothetical protein